MITELTFRNRHIQLAKIIGDTNGCTIPLSKEIAPAFQIHGKSTLSINRYFTVHAEDILGMVRKKRADLDNQNLLEILGLEEYSFSFFDFGTVTSSRTPIERMLPPKNYGTIAFLEKKDQLFIAKLDKQTDRRHKRTSSYLGKLFKVIKPEDDITRKIQSSISLEKITGNVKKLASRVSKSKNEILLTRKKQIAQELGDMVRDMLGWNHHTITAHSGTYLNAHLSILAGAQVGQGGGLNFLTNETGGNAPRAAYLNQLHFGSDQAGKNVDHSKETPIFKDGRTPGLVYTVALRNEKANQRWGKGKEHNSFGKYIVHELQRAISKNRAHNKGKPFNVIVNIADRPKTSGMISISDLSTISKYISLLKKGDSIRNAYFIIDGCQSRGEAIKGIHHKDGPIVYFEEQGVYVDGVSWTTSKAPGGTPFAAGLTLRNEIYQDLRTAIEKADKDLDYDDGFTVKYIKQGDFSIQKSREERLIEKRAIANFDHHLRLLGDLPRLWRWAEVYTNHELAIASTKARLAQEIAGEGKYLIALEELSDPSVLNLRINHNLVSDEYDLTIIAKLLRLGFDVNKLENSNKNEFTPFEKAAALISTPTGQTVVERVVSEIFRDTTLPALDNRITHEPIIRFAINLELAETAAFDSEKINVIIPKLGNIINTRIRLILQNYKELSNYLLDLESGRAIAEDTFYNAPPELRYYNEEKQGYAVAENKSAFLR